MKKVRLFVLCICALILGVMAIACGTNNHQSDENSNEEESMGDIRIVPVYYNPTGKFDNNYRGLKDDVYWGFAFVDSNGDVLKFDNEADYSEYCALIYFIRKAIDYKLVNNPETTDEEIIEYRNTLINGVVKYALGQKNRIENAQVAESIDRAFYDYHPLDEYFRMTRSKYGSKTFESNKGLQYTHASGWSKHPKIDNNWQFENGDTIPQGSLVFHTCFYLNLMYE